MSYNSNYTGDEVVELLGRQFVVPVVSSVPDNTLSSWHDNQLNKDFSFKVSDLCKYGDQVYQLLSIDSGSYNWAVLSHVVYLPEEILEFNNDTNVSDAVALLGDLEVLYNNVRRGCMFAVKCSSSGTQQRYINVDINVNKTVFIYQVLINYSYCKSSEELLDVNIVFMSNNTTVGTSKISCKKVNVAGLPKERIALPMDLWVSLDSDITTSSSSDEISAVFGGVLKFKELVNSILKGVECYFPGLRLDEDGSVNYISEMPACCMVSKTDSSITLFISCIGYYFTGNAGGTIIISFDEESQLFSCIGYIPYSVVQ